MANPKSTQLEDMIRRIDEALVSNPALTGEQMADVRRLRTELIVSHKAGRMEEAQRCEALALALIKEGAPAPE